MIEDEGAVCLLYRKRVFVAFHLEMHGQLFSGCFSDSSLSQFAFRNPAEDLVLLGCGGPALRRMCEQALLSPGQ